MKCKEQAGFLIKHECKRTPELTCSICGKDVCNDHARETDEGFACITCYKKQHVNQSIRSGRRDYYHDPYYYGYYHSYHPYSMRDSFSTSTNRRDAASSVSRRLRRASCTTSVAWEASGRPGIRSCP